MNVIGRPKAAKPVPARRNRVDTSTLFATIGAVVDNPERAKCQVRSDGP